MRDRTLHRHFERYRRKGDVAALGDLFDAVAPELQRVAASLVRDVSAADDLVQATFLTAIEKAETWDASRRLVPWLMGILVRHAHMARRDAGRTPDPQRVMEERPEPADPTREAERREAEATLRQAVEALPERYREVLAPYVFDGERAAEIAARLGRSPGVVRMQQSRGFELLRRSLSSALALGLVLELGGAGLAGVRSRVMNRAAARAPELLAAVAAGSVAAGSASTLPGALALTAKALAATAGVAALVLGLVYVADLAAQPADLERENALAPPASTDSELAGLDAARGGAGELEAGAGAADSREEASVAVESTPVAPVGENVAAVHGRIVEEDGRPVSGIPVELLAVDLSILERGVADVFEPVSAPTYVVDSGVTDAEGGYRFDRVPFGSVSVLAVDVGRDRPYARILDEGLVRGERTALLDTVLPAAGALAGRVLDPNGEPVRGVRVRVGVVDAPDRWGYYASVRAGTPIQVSVGILSAVLDLPPWFDAAERLVPVSTAHTDENGRYEFPTAPAREAHLFVDHPGFEGLAYDLPDAAVTENEEGFIEVAEREIADLALSRGRVLEGRVVDGTGEPVAGAEVRAGSRTTLGWGGPEIALLVQHTVSDEVGRFSLSGLGADDEAVVAVRLAEGEPWAMTKAAEEGSQTVEVLARFDVTVAFVDGAGEPVTGVELRVRRPQVIGGLVPTAALLDPWSAVGEPEALGEGRWQIAGLPRGTYTLTARAEGLTAQEFRLRASRSSARREQEFVLQSATPLPVRVVDDASDAPVSGARVSVLAAAGRERSLGVGRTDGRGEVAIPIAAEALNESAALRITHAAYGARSVVLDRTLEGAEQVVRLAPAGSVEVQVDYSPDGGPAEGYMVVLDEPQGPEVAPGALHVRTALVDAEGRARLSDVAPGTWRLVVYPRTLDRPPLELIRRGAGLPARRTEVVVEPGAVARVATTVHRPGAPTLPVGTGELIVRVTRDGQPVTDRAVRLVGVDALNGYAQLDLDAAGLARFTRLPEGELRVSVGSNGDLGEALSLRDDHIERVTLGVGEIEELAIVFDSAPLFVQVVDENGAPMRGVAVNLSNREHGHYRTAHSDAAGELRIDDWDAGETHLNVDTDGVGVGAATLEAVAGRLNEVRLDVILGVPCAGELVLPEGSPDVFAFLHVFAADETERGQRGALGSAVIDCENGRGKFEIMGLRPGRYVATTTWGAPSGRLSNVEFELLAGGSTSLRLTPTLIE